jgi:hypothetical protein
VLVSPAYHRLHHAPGAPCINLGVALTIWDVLAGCASFPGRGASLPARAASVPARGGGAVPTGLAGRPVPVEQDGPARPGLLLLAAQLTEPFHAQRLPPDRRG